MLARLLAWYGVRRGGRTVVVVWLATRVLTLVLLATAERFITGDVFYYWRHVALLGDVGLPMTLREYPTPVVWFLSIPYGLAGGTRVGYLVGFLGLMLLLDALFAYALWRSAGRRHDPGLDVWLLYVFLLGPLSYVRFDMVPAVLAGGAVLALARRPWLAGALTGLGAAIKLWPALLIAAFAAPRRGRVAALAGFVAVGFGLAGLSLVVGGRTRLFSPLTWQSGRGLQIESVWATPLMVARMVDPDRWSVAYSRFQAYEVFGPGVAPLLALSTAMTALGLLVVVALIIRAFRHPAPDTVAIGLLVLSMVSVTTITNKTLSPQYLLWLGGPMAALLLLRGDDLPVERRSIGRLAGQLLALALLTHLVFPVLYDGFLGRQGQIMIIVSTLVTAARNVFLVVFTVEACRLAWRRLARPATSG